MGIFDFLSSSPEKKIASLRKKIQERYGQPESRQMAMDKLLDMGGQEAVAALMMRFKVSVDPSITDASEKEYLFGSLVRMDRSVVMPAVREYLMNNDEAANWAIRILSEILPENEVVDVCIEALNKIGPDYTRDPEKKIVLIQTLSRKNGGKIPEVLVPFLQDPADEVRIETAFALAKHKDEASSALPLVRALIDSEDRKRVASNIADALVETEFTIPESEREAAAKALPEGYSITESGKVIAKR